MSKSASAYPFLTRKQIQARIEFEPAFMKECARLLQTRTEQRAAGAAPPGKPWGWMSSERVVAGRLVEKLGVGMLSVDDEVKLAKLVSRYSRQLADHHRTIALVENPALSEAAEKFGVLSTGVNPPDTYQTQPEPKEIASRCHLEPNRQANDLENDPENDPEVDSEFAREDDLSGRAMEFVAANAGSRTDAIARAMGVTTVLLGPALRMLVQGRRLRKQGVGRGTRYFTK